jgi:beta-galactosidase
VALIFSWPNWWNVEYRPGPSSALDYVDEIGRYYRPLWDRNIAVDIVSPDSDLSGYDLVIAPLLNMVSAEQGAAFTRYVERGGTFLTTFFSGVVDENDRAWLGGYPGPLRRMLGLWVEEFDPLTPDMRNRVQVPEGGGLPAGSYDCDLWCDLVQLEGAQALATYGDDFYAGRPAITEHRFGKGRALYVATRPDPALLAALVARVLGDLGVTAPLDAPPGVEITRREGAGRGYTFVLNHQPHPVQIPLPQPMRDLLTGQTHAQAILVPPLDVAILTT